MLTLAQQFEKAVDKELTYKFVNSRRAAFWSRKRKILLSQIVKQLNAEDVHESHSYQDSTQDVQFGRR